MQHSATFVAGQAVLVSPSNSQNYFVCFYLPSELSGQSHSPDTHTLFIEGPNGQIFGPGTVSELTAASAPNPGDLAQLTSGGNFTGTASNGTAFYYDTGRTMVEGENLSWNIYLRDSGGLTSRKMTASTIVRPANMTVSGETLLTTTIGENTTTLTASVDEGTVGSWQWESNNTDIATVSPNNSSSVTITAAGGGETTVTVTATLLDGRIVQGTKTIRVLDVNFDSSSPQDFIKGQENVAQTASKPDFATLSWASTDTNIASVNASGQVTAVAKGSTTITATASYGGKSVSKTQNIYVHEVTVSQDGGSNRHELFVGSNETISYTPSVSSPEGRPAPTGITYIWQNINDSVVTMTASGNSRTFKASTTTAGSSTIYCRAKLNDVQTIVMTTGITVYNHSISVTPPTSKNANNGDSSWSSSSTYYALTNLNDAFSLSVTTASSFPSGTSFGWTITDANNNSIDKTGSSASVKPSEVGTIGTTPSTKTQWTVTCTATLPSGLSSTKTQSFYVYKLTIPSITISISNPPTELRLDSSYPNKYFVGSNDKSKTFTFTANYSGYMPNGVTYSWYVGTRGIGSGNPLTPTIQTLRNSISEPTSNESCTVRCEVTLTGCDPKSGSTSFTFAAPKTFDSTNFPFGITNTSSWETGYYNPTTLAYKVTAENYYTNFVFGLPMGYSYPEGYSISWVYSYHPMHGRFSFDKTGSDPTFTLSPEEIITSGGNNDEGANFETWSANSGNFSLSITYTISAPGYEKKRGSISLFICKRFQDESP